MTTLLHLDTTLFLFVNHTLANPVFDAFFTCITNGKFWIVPGILAALFFLYRSKKKAAVVILLMLVTVGISDPVCNRIIKPHFHRLRPCNDQVHIEGGRFLLGHKGSLSFPSSHAMNMFAQAALLALLYRRRRVTVIVFTFASLIALSRVYVGVHYPADVTAGAIFGMLTGAFVYFSVSALAHKYFWGKWCAMFTKERDIQTESKQTST